jgi:hypothetical protein
MSTVDTHVYGEQTTSVAVTEWVVEAGPRLWIVRTGQGLGGDALSPPTASTATLSGARTELKSPNLNELSTSLASTRSSALDSPREQLAADGMGDLPFPTWWAGDCNTVNFERHTGAPAYPLGAEFRGVKACGPRPWRDGGPSRWVDFGEGANQIEWQCPELSKRFLYLAYGIPPYSAHGSQVVWNYGGERLEKVPNCTPGRAPMPGDILSYGSLATYGHTAVVTASDVDPAGNGTIEVMEQNSSSDGASTLYVDDWCVEAYSEVTGWLHDPEWLVAYYQDDTLTEGCASENREGPYLFETWSDGAPVDGCPVDGFGARFSRGVDFAGGDYTFALGYDDGARLWVDGELVIDGWGAGNQHYATRHLDAGHHQITVEYYDGVGDASLTLFWWGPGFELVREERSDPSRWYAEHWGHPTPWWDPVVTVIGGDGPLRYEWDWGAPANNLPVDNFSSRFRRTVSLGAGVWRFDLFSDDGVRFWIDDHLIVDQWQPQRAQFTPMVTLGEGNHELVVEHYENEEVADVALDWERVYPVTAPVAWVALPLDGATVDTCPVTVVAEGGSELDSVDRLELYAQYDDAWHRAGVDHTAPYAWSWDCTAIDDQVVHLMVHAWDGEGSHFVDLDGGTSIVLERLDPSEPPSDVYLPLVLGP